MKIILSNILLIIALASIGQTKNSVHKLTGLYFGGQSYGESMNGIGYYYFNSDSTFIFIRTALNPNAKTKEFKERFYDTLLGYGKGHWYTENKTVVIKFETISDENIQNGKLQYTGYSNAPFDSLFFNISVTNYDESTLGTATVIFPTKNIGSATDTLGFSKAALAKSDNIGNILVSKSGYLDMSITLPKNFNVHEFSISLAKADKSYVELVSKGDYTFKFHYENKILVFDGKLIKQNAGKEKLIYVIKNSLAKFPMQTVLLQKLMKELK